MSQQTVTMLNKKLITDHVRSTREGNFFTGVCDSVHGGELEAPTLLCARPKPGR